jgi:hypothetical protein
VRHYAHASLPVKAYRTFEGEGEATWGAVKLPPSNLLVRLKFNGAMRIDQTSFSLPITLQNTGAIFDRLTIRSVICVCARAAGGVSAPAIEAITMVPRIFTGLDICIIMHM